ncbi:MAG: T9SS type A sorting domain-containing protein [Balneolaceae bacterium]
MKTRDTRLKHLNKFIAAWLFLLIGFSMPANAQSADDQYWSAQFGVTGFAGPPGSAFIFTTHTASNGVYVGGAFTAVNGKEANSIAFWNGSEWESLGDGLNLSSSLGLVTTIFTEGNKVYVGGDFSHAGTIEVNGLAVWDTTTKTWSAVGTGTNVGVNGNVSAITKVGSKLYVAGNFSQAGGNTANNIAVWDGSSWSALGSGTNNTINEIAEINSEIYAVGKFTTAGGNAASRMAKWNGSTWTEFAGGADNEVFTISAIDTSIYIGGKFANIDGNAIKNIGRWDGTAWNKFTTQPNGAVRAISNTSNGLLVAGEFTEVGILDAVGVARWNGSSWNVANETLKNDLTSIAVVTTISEYEGKYILGGVFSNTDTHILNNIASLSPTMELSTFNGISTGKGIIGAVGAITADGNNFYAGGEFVIAGTTLANGIAKWNGNTWEALSGGVDGVINSILKDGNKIYVSGDFSKAGEVDADNIAVYNTSTNTWSALGDGTNGVIFDMIKVGSKVYAAGDFSQAGGNSANNIAVWDGAAWAALGSGIGGGIEEIYTLATMNGTIIAAGKFSSGSLENIAYWDGSSWNQIVGGIDGDVYALEVVGDTLLYVGGDFTTVDGASVNAKNIAVWNGIDWNPVGLGFDAPVHALTFKDNVLFAGGEFENSGISEISRIASWNGTKWNSIGSGIKNTYGSDRVLALAITTDNHLYIGGVFAKVGDKIAQSISSYDLGQNPVSNEVILEVASDFVLDQNYPNPFNPSTNINFHVPSQSPVTLKVFNMLGQEVATLVNQVKAAGSYTVSFDASNLSSGMYIYRLTAANTSITRKMMLLK